MSRQMIAGIAALAMMSAQGTAMKAATVNAARRMQASTPASAAITPPHSGSITVPVGTQIALNLVGQVKSKSTKVGDTVRAQVAFPVTAGDQIAIPAGTFAEGQLVQDQWPKGTKAKDKSGKSPLTIHFTRLVFANGYVASMNGVNVALNTVPDSGGVELAMNEMPALPFAASGSSPMLFVMGQFPTQPTLPPEPARPGPNPVALSLGLVGGTVLLALGFTLLARHSVRNADYLLFDAGWQFQMALNQPLVLDRAQVMEAATIAAPAQ